MKTLTTENVKNAKANSSLCSLRLIALSALSLIPFVISAQSIREKLDSHLAKVPHPTSVADFQPIPHLPVQQQDKTLICWSFGTCSLLESEMTRLRMKPARLSVVYPVYCAFLEKTKYFVQTKGASRFSPGDLFTALLDVSRDYGAMPASVYGEKKTGQVFDHTKLYAELDALMKTLKTRKDWNEKRALDKVRKILNKHLGEPPKTFSIDGKTYTPQSYLSENVKLPLDDYVLVTSFQNAPFHTFTELKVPDNWKHHSNYFNVPLETFYNSLKQAVQSGFSVALNADISEPSYRMTKRYGIIPDFDIPAANIDQQAREFRFSNETTTDDHLMQIVGYKNFNGEDWFLVKDSWHIAWENEHPGYVFFHSSYVKLKVLSFLVHKDGVPEIKSLLKAN